MEHEALLKHCLTALRQQGQGSSAAATFECAASQLQVLSAPALLQASAADLADELLGKAETLLSSKQVSVAMPAPC